MKLIAKKGVALFLAMAMAVPVISAPVFSHGANFSDIGGHWAESYINKAVSRGFVKGYPDGTFQPDKPVSRAEFTSMVNKALGNNNSTTITFRDVPYNEWYYKDVTKGVAAGFVGGYPEDNTFRPNNPLSRQEAAVMVSRFVPVANYSGSLSTFGDSHLIDSWARDAAAKVYGKGYIGAYDDGKYHPRDSLTRAQTAKILCSILDKETIASSDPTVKSRGTVLSNRIYTNNVTIHSDLGSGNAELSNCVVLGTLNVNGGGENTVRISNSRIANANIERSGSNRVRVLATGQTTVSKVTAGRYVTLETSSLTGGLSGIGFGEVDIKGSSEAILRGNFKKVNVTGSSVNLEIESGSVDTLNMSNSSRNSKVTVNSRASIGTANVNAAVDFKGSGTISTMNVNANGVTYVTKPRYINTASGIKSPNSSDSEQEITVYPKHKATYVKKSTDITLEFDREVSFKNGSTIRDRDIPDMVYIREGSESGSKVSYNASISSNKKKITISPKSSLSTDTRYYVVIDKNQFYDDRGNGNKAQTTYFSTGADKWGDLKFYPKDGETGVERSIKPEIRFSEAAETYSGNKIDSKYLKNNIEFRKNSSSGSRVDFTAEIDRKRKVITIYPDYKLSEGHRYYLYVGNRVFRTEDGGKSINGGSVTWTVGRIGEIPKVTFTPKNDAVNVAPGETVHLQFSTTMYNSSGSSIDTNYIKNYIKIRHVQGSTNIDYSISENNNKSSGLSIKLKPTTDMKAGNKYTVSIESGRFKDSNGNYLPSSSATFTVAGNIDLARLNRALDEAEVAGRDTKVSENGQNVLTTEWWTTKVVRDTFDAAVNAAKAKKSSAITTKEANDAAILLENATTVFKNAKTKGIKVPPSTEDLDIELENAKNLKNSVQISVDGFDCSEDSQWVLQADMDKLDAAIKKAEELKSKLAEVSYQDVLNCEKELRKANGTFEDAKKPGLKPDKIGLTAAILEARTLLNNTRTSEKDGSEWPSNVMWATPAAKETFDSEIVKAEQVERNPKATKENVTQALEALKLAKEAFNPQPGTKPAG